jgi:hypothetical protein
LKDPFFDDTFAALMPFATGSARAMPGRQHRDMPLDVKEVRTRHLRANYILDEWLFMLLTLELLFL